MNALVALLPIVLLLACPVMMIFCFWGMRRMSGSPESRRTVGHDAMPAQVLSPAEQARLLQIRLEHLRMEQAAIASQLDQLASSELATGPTVTNPQNGSGELEGGRA